MRIRTTLRQLAAVCLSAALSIGMMPTVPHAAAAATITVGKNGTYKTVGEAVSAAAKLGPSGEGSRVTIAIEPGTYREQLLINTPYLSFVNSNPGGGEVLITWYYGIGYKYYSSASSGYYKASDAQSKSAKGVAQRWGTAVRLQSGAKYFRAENITFENSFNRYMTSEEVADGVEPTGETLTVQRKSGLDVTAKSATERAAAMCVEADYCEFFQCSFLSSQDTLYTATPAYFKACKIQGNTDYIFGSGDVVFDQCELCFGGYSDNAVGGYITAAREQTKGYLFWECNVTANPDKKVGAGYFGRPWRDTAHVLFYNTKLQYEGIITGVGWHSMSGVEPSQATFREYNTKTASGGNVNTSQRTSGTVLSSCNATREEYLGSWVPYYMNSTGTVVRPGAKFRENLAFVLRNVNSGLYLCADASGNLSQGDRSAAVKLIAMPAFGDDGYYTLSADNSSLNTADGSPENGAAIRLSTGAGGDSLLFKFVSTGSGSYEIVTKSSGDAGSIGVSGGSRDAGASVVQWESNGSADQQWIPEFEGRLLSALVISDCEHQESWGMMRHASEGVLIYGDRDFTFRTLPDALNDGETVMTACDAKYSTGTLAECRAAADITLYVAMDTRVTSVPAWIAGWTQTDLRFTSSNDVEFVCYAHDFAAGEAITLGENGQSSNCMNYAVIAAARQTAIETTLPETTTASAETTTASAETTTASAETEPVPVLTGLAGDADCSGDVNVADAVLLARFLAEDSEAAVSAQGKANANVSGDSDVTSDDLTLILEFLAGIRQSL